MGGRGSTSGARRNFAIDKNLNGTIINIEREMKFIGDLRNGRINTSIDADNQNKHIISREWKNNVKQQMAKINSGDSKAQSPKSRLYANINPADLVEKYSGTGMLSFRKTALLSMNLSALVSLLELRLTEKPESMLRPAVCR